MSSEMTFEDLCEDLLILIFDKYLDLRSKIRAQRVCKKFRDLIEGLFDGKRSLYLTEDSEPLREICDEDVNKYSFLSIQSLSRQRDGVWMRGQRGLRLLQPIDIQMLALKKHKNLMALCLVVRTRGSLELLTDLILQNCSSNLEKLIIIDLNGTKFSINVRQMESLCGQYSRLKHFEIFSDYLYATEECFALLMNRCQSLEVFKLNVRHIFSERLELLGADGGHSITYDSYKFNGFCFAESSGNLRTIHASHPILNESVIVNKLPQMADRFANLRHLGVERLSPLSMETICNVFKNLESLSFSMNDLLENDFIKTKSLIASMSRLERLSKLSIQWFGTKNESTVPIDYYVLQSLKDCSHLKHVIMKEAVLGEQSFTAIYKVMPNLESLKVIDCTLNRNSLKPIKHLNQLKELVVLQSYPETHLKFSINKMDENTVRDITDNCIVHQLIDPPKRKPVMAAPQDLQPHIMEGHNGEPIVVVGAQWAPLDDGFEFMSGAYDDLNIINDMNEHIENIFQ